MSFFKKIQNTLGFGTPEVDDDPGVDLPKDAPNEIPKITADTPIEMSEEIKHKIFDKVVEITNAALPGYLASAVDPAKQKKYLYDALDVSVKEYIATLDEKSQAKCMALWQSERDELRNQMDTFKQRAADLEAKRAEMNEQKLSSDRQRRALSDRVHDLETKVMELEAEKEQFEIENRSLINKAKVAAVYETDMETMRKELEELKKSATQQTSIEEITELKKEAEYLRAENQRLITACEAAKVKDEMSDAMLNNLQKRASESQQNAKDSGQKIVQLEDEIALKDAQISDLMQQIKEKDARLAEDEEAFEQFEQLSSKLDLFEDTKKKYEEKILQLKKDLQNLQKENETLQSTIQSNLYAHAQQEQTMKEQIDKLKSTPIAGEDFSFDSDTL